MQPEAVFHGHAEPGQERAREFAEALLGRYSLIAVVEEVRYLPIQALVMRQIGHVTDVLVGTDEDKMVRLREEAASDTDVARLINGGEYQRGGES